MEKVIGTQPGPGYLLGYKPAANRKATERWLSSPPPLGSHVLSSAYTTPLHAGRARSLPTLLSLCDVCEVFDDSLLNSLNKARPRDSRAVP